MTFYFRIIWSIAACVLTGLGSASADPKPLVTLPIREDKEAATPLQQSQWLGFSPDGEWLAVRFAASDRVARVRVWKFGDWKATDTEFHCRATTLFRSACAYDPAKPVLYAAGDYVLHACDLPPKGRPRNATGGLGHRVLGRPGGRR